MKKRVVGLIVIFILILSLFSYLAFSQGIAETSKTDIENPNLIKVTDNTREINKENLKQVQEKLGVGKLNINKRGSNIEVKRTQPIDQKARRERVKKGPETNLLIKGFANKINKINFEKDKDNNEFLIIDITPGEYKIDRLMGKPLKIPLDAGHDIEVELLEKELIFRMQSNEKKPINVRTNKGGFVTTEKGEDVVSYSNALNEKSLGSLSKADLSEENPFIDFTKIPRKFKEPFNLVEIIMNKDATITVLNQWLSKKDKKIVDEAIRGIKGKATVLSYTDYEFLPGGRTRAKEKFKILETSDNAKMQTIAGLIPIGNKKEEPPINLADITLNTGSLSPGTTKQEIIPAEKFEFPPLLESIQKPEKLVGKDFGYEIPRDGRNEDEILKITLISRKDPSGTIYWLEKKEYFDAEGKLDWADLDLLRGNEIEGYREELEYIYPKERQY